MPQLTIDVAEIVDGDVPGGAAWTLTPHSEGQLADTKLVAAVPQNGTLDGNGTAVVDVRPTPEGAWYVLTIDDPTRIDTYGRPLPIGTWTLIIGTQDTTAADAIARLPTPIGPTPGTPGRNGLTGRSEVQCFTENPTGSPLPPVPAGGLLRISTGELTAPEGWTVDASTPDDGHELVIAYGSAGPTAADEIIPDWHSVALAGAAGPAGKDGRGIKSITEASDELTVTLTDDSTEGPFALPAGPAGRGIKSITEASDELTVTLTDDSTEGPFALPAGPAGRGIKSITEASDELTVTLTDDSTEGPFALPAGPAGRGIKSITEASDELTVTLTDDSTEGPFALPRGPKGDQADPVPLTFLQQHIWSNESNVAYTLAAADRDKVLVFALTDARSGQGKATWFQAPLGTLADDADIRVDGTPFTIGFAYGGSGTGDVTISMSVAGGVNTWNVYLYFAAGQGTAGASVTQEAVYAEMKKIVEAAGDDALQIDEFDLSHQIAFGISPKGVTTAKIADHAIGIDQLPDGAAAGKYLEGDGSWSTPPDTEAVHVTAPIQGDGTTGHPIDLAAGGVTDAYLAPAVSAEIDEAAKTATSLGLAFDSDSRSLSVKRDGTGANSVTLPAGSSSGGGGDGAVGTLTELGTLTVSRFSRVTDGQTRGISITADETLAAHEVADLVVTYSGDQHAAIEFDVTGLPDGVALYGVATRGTIPASGTPTPAHIRVLSAAETGLQRKTVTITLHCSGDQLLGPGTFTLSAIRAATGGGSGDDTKTYLDNLPARYQGKHLAVNSADAGYEWVTQPHVGEWADLPAGFSFPIGTMCSRHSLTYIAIAEHTKGGTGPDADDTNWRIVTDWAGDYDENAWYHAGTRAVYDGEVITALTDIAPSDPDPDRARNTKWLVREPSRPGVAAASGATAYTGRVTQPDGSAPTEISLDEPITVRAGHIATLLAVPLASSGTHTSTLPRSARIAVDVGGGLAVLDSRPLQILWTGERGADIIRDTGFVALHNTTGADVEISKVTVTPTYEGTLTSVQVNYRLDWLTADAPSDWVANARAALVDTPAGDDQAAVEWAIDDDTVRAEVILPDVIPERAQFVNDSRTSTPEYSYRWDNQDDTLLINPAVSPLNFGGWKTPANGYDAGRAGVAWHFGQDFYLRPNSHVVSGTTFDLAFGIKIKPAAFAAGDLFYVRLTPNGKARINGSSNRADLAAELSAHDLSGLLNLAARITWDGAPSSSDDTDSIQVQMGAIGAEVTLDRSQTILTAYDAATEGVPTQDFATHNHLLGPGNTLAVATGDQAIAAGLVPLELLGTFTGATEGLVSQWATSGTDNTGANTDHTHDKADVTLGSLDGNLGNKQIFLVAANNLRTLRLTWTATTAVSTAHRCYLIREAPGDRPRVVGSYLGSTSAHSTASVALHGIAKGTKFWVISDGSVGNPKIAWDASITSDPSHVITRNGYRAIIYKTRTGLNNNTGWFWDITLDSLQLPAKLGWAALTAIIAYDDVSKFTYRTGPIWHGYGEESTLDSDTNNGISWQFAADRALHTGLRGTNDDTLRVEAKTQEGQALTAWRMTRIWIEYRTGIGE